MKPVELFYIRIFLLLGLTFGLVTEMLGWLQGDDFSVSHFLFKASFFGFVMAAFIGTSHLYGVRDQGVTELTHENLSPFQELNIVSDTAPDDLLQQLKADRKVGKMEIVKNGRHIKINSGMTWMSVGEKCRVTARPLADGQYDYTISSRPLWKFTLVDYGKNLQNVNHIKRILVKERGYFA